MTAVASSTPTTAVLLPIEGTTRWDGTITLNYYDKTTSGAGSEKALFDAALNPLTTSHAGLSSAWQTAIEKAFAAYKLVANVNYTFDTNDTSATYMVGDQDTTQNGNVVLGYFEFPAASTQLAGAFNVTTSAISSSTETGGGGGMQWVTLHEVGHAWGLAHPFGAGNGSTVSTDTTLYNSNYTVMAYENSSMGQVFTDDHGLPVTPMALDIAAVQHMYGASNAYVGETNYQLTSSGTALDVDGSDGTISIGRAYYCIWDTGNTDTIQYDGSSRTLINLNAATLSLTDSAATTSTIDALKLTSAWSALTATTQAEIDDPDRHAGGFFSSLLNGSGARADGGYTIANGVVIEQAISDAGNDILVGNDSENLLWSKAGNDAVVDGGGADVVLVGSGTDEVRLVKDTDVDIVIGGDGADKIIGYAGGDDSSADVLVAFGGELDQVALPTDIAEFAGISAGLASDITAITGRLPTGYSAGTSDGADTLSGGAGADTLSGGGGADQLSGGLGNDLLLGDAGADSLDGGAGEDNLFGGAGTDSLAGGDGADLLATGDTDQRLNGGAGADKLVLKHATAAVDPGAGNDLVDLSQLPAAADGAVTITLGDDFGHDYVKTPVERLTSYTIDASSFSKSSLQLVIGPGRLSDVVTETHEGNGSNNGASSTVTSYINDDVFVQLGSNSIRVGSGLTQHVEGEPVFGGPGDWFQGVSEQVTIHFSDGDVDINAWIQTHQENISFSAPSSFSLGAKDFYLARNLGSDGADSLVGGSGDDFLVGNDGDDSFAGGSGSDHLEGGAGADEFAIGSGNDFADGGDGDDTAIFTGAYADYSIAVTNGVLSVTNTASGDVTTLVSIEHLAFSDQTVAVTGGDTFLGTAGADELSGTELADSFAGKAGDDILTGDRGSDTYSYASGDGSDVINDWSPSILDEDVLRLTDLTAADITVTDVDETLEIHITATGATIQVTGQFSPGPGHVGIEQIQFAGGQSWDRNQIDSAAHVGSGINGTSGDDSLAGTALNDTISGGMGDDTMAGGARGDVYVYHSGDGNDVLIESDPSTDATDILQLVGLAPGDITLSATDDDVIVHVTATGETVTLHNQVRSSLDHVGIDQIQFTGGVTWDRAALLSHLPAGWNEIDGTTGADSLVDTHRDDVLVGGLGDDTISSDQGQDTFLYHSGDGSDRIIDQSADLVEIDTLRLADLNASDITLAKSGDNLLVHVTATGSVIEVVDQFKSHSENYGLEAIKFQDGSSWSRSQFFDHLPANWAEIPGTSGADSLVGTSEDDIFLGGAGNDTMEGAAGSDTFKYASGDGSDRISDQGAFYFDDALKLTDLNASDVTLTRAGNDLLIHITATGDTITLVDQMASNGFGAGIERLVFANNEEWQRYEFADHLDLTGTSGDDTIEGGDSGDSISGADGNDVLAGGLGNDTLTGGAGADTFRYDSVDDSPSGDYHDLIADFVSGTDVIDLSGIDANPNISGDQSFTWIGTASFSNVAGQLRYEVTSTGARMILGDLNGNGVEDFQIEVQTASSLGASDFVL